MAFQLEKFDSLSRHAYVFGHFHVCPQQVSEGVFGLLPFFVTVVIDHLVSLLADVYKFEENMPENRPYRVRQVRHHRCVRCHGCLAEAFWGAFNVD